MFGRTLRVRNVTDANRRLRDLCASSKRLQCEGREDWIKTFLARQITLPVGAEIRLDIALEVGQVSEQVTIQATAALLETGKYRSVSGDEPEANCRPAQIGRNFLELAALSAGAIPKMANRSTQYGNREVTHGCTVGERPRLIDQLFNRRDRSEITAIQ